MGHTGKLPPSLSLGPAPDSPCKPVGVPVVQKGEEGPSTILSIDSSKAMLKGGVKLELLELGKMENVTFLVLCVLWSGWHCSYFIIFPDSSFPPLLLLSSWLSSLQVLMQAWRPSLEAVPSACDTPVPSFRPSPGHLYSSFRSLPSLS